MRIQTFIVKGSELTMLYDPAFVGLYAQGESVTHTRVSYVNRNDTTGEWFIDLRPALPVLDLTEEEAAPLDRGPFPSKAAAIEYEIAFMQSHLQS